MGGRKALMGQILVYKLINCYARMYTALVPVVNFRATAVGTAPVGSYTLLASILHQDSRKA